MKKGFSLVELMIVIVIIGIIYTLAVSKLHNVGQEKLQPTFANLKEYLATFLQEDAKEVRLLCLDSCESCSIYVNGVKQKEIESFFDASVEVYRYEFNQGFIRKERNLFFNQEGRDEDICFSFSMNKSLVSDQVVVLYKQKAYDYTTYFTPTKVYGNLEEVLEAKEQLGQAVAR